MLDRVAGFLFGLPPTEKRMVPKWFVHIVSNDQETKRRYDDVFIYYLVARTSLYVGFLFSLLNVISQMLAQPLNFYFFIVNSSGTNYVETFLLTYTKYTATALIFFVLPYYFMVWWYGSKEMTRIASLYRCSKELGKDSRFYIVSAQVFLIFPVGMYGLFCLFDVYMKPHHLENSYSYFLLCCLIMPIAYAVFNALFFHLAIRFFVLFRTRHLETAENKLEDNSHS